jgi:mycobactin lysine-N-oxygenase
MTEERLIIIGAGPKAMAVAAKAHVLAELGFPVPRIQIIERRKVGAHWTGDSGYTNGLLRLSTPPEKDVGFPYRSTCWANEEMNRAINARMTRFSWQSFLVELDLFAEWVDRGRPAPEHRRWAEYLQWVAGGVSGSVTIHYGEVQRISIQDGRWRLSYRSPEGRSLDLEGEGLMLTGPGRTSATADAPRHDRVLTIEQFWTRHARFRSLDAARVAVVGSGESAAAIVMELASNGNPALRIDVISPIGMTYSRGESFRENHLYSNPEVGRWKHLSESDRRGFIHRTDQGVFSVASQQALNQAENLNVVPGRLRKVAVEGGGRVLLTLDYDQGRRTYTCDHVVLAMGYDHLAAARGMLDDEARREILEQTGLGEITDRALEAVIEPHFEVRGLTPRLHLPMLSRLTQGPGFANLSCLGGLSDSVLTAYVQRGHRREAWPERAAAPRLAVGEPTWVSPEARLATPRVQPTSPIVP